MNTLLKMLRMLLNLAMDIGMIQVNPAIGMRGFSRHSQGFHTWSEDEIEAFRQAHAIGTRARLALELLLHTGQRRGDVLRMGWQHVKDGWITVAQQKSHGKKLEIPMHPTLVDALCLAPFDNMTFLTTRYGKPFSKDGFSKWFRMKCNAAGLKHCSAHGLRKAASR